MPRSPSPRGYQRDPPSRPPYRDRSFRPNQSQSSAGPSRYREDDRHSHSYSRDGGRQGYSYRQGQGQGHERDQPPFDRNAGRTWGNYNSRREGRDSRGWSRSRSRSRSASDDQPRKRARSRSLSTDRHRHQHTGRIPNQDRPGPGVGANDSARASQASRSKSPSRSRAAASATPEEGQITSPNLSARGAATKQQRNNASPGPSLSNSRRRSPSPVGRRDRWDDRNRDRDRPRGGVDRDLPREREMDDRYHSRSGLPAGRHRHAEDSDARYDDRYRSGWGGRGGSYRGNDMGRRDRDRDRGWNDVASGSGFGRDGDRFDRRSRSPLPAQRYSRRSSRSPSTASSFRSSRFNSPDKRRSPVKNTRRDISRSPLPPIRDRDEDRSDRNRERRGSRDRGGRDSRDAATPPPAASTPLKGPPAPVQVPTPAARVGSTMPLRQPPAGPRSDRIPSGPRGFGFVQPVPPPVPQPPPAQTAQRDRDPTSPPAPPGPPPPPPSDPPPPAAAQSKTQSPIQTARLSWSERKKIASPVTSNFPTGGNTTSSSGPTVTAVDAGPNPYSQPIAGPSRQPTHSLEQAQINPQQPREIGSSAPLQHHGALAPGAYSHGYVGRRPYSRDSMHVDTPSPPVPPASRPRTPSPPRISEEELAVRKQREEEARIIAELPALRVGYTGTIWEREVERHYAAVQAAEAANSRAQAGLRMARAILADVELERQAAVERRKVCEEQLNKGSMGLGVLSGV